MEYKNLVSRNRRLKRYELTFLARNCYVTVRFFYMTTQCILERVVNFRSVFFLWFLHEILFVLDYGRDMKMKRFAHRYVILAANTESRL